MFPDAQRLRNYTGSDSFLEVWGGKGKKGKKMFQLKKKNKNPHKIGGNSVIKKLICYTTKSVKQRYEYENQNKCELKQNEL